MILEKRWKILPFNEDNTKELQKVLGISPSLCNLLAQRGVASYEEAKNYFRPQLNMLHSPWLMKDMQKAVNRVMTAIANNEKILIFGDYDVDGTTAVACMYQFVVSIYDAELVDFYIPHRYREGYGVSKMGIDYAAANGFSLIVCLDCGIKSIDLIGYAAVLGIDFIDFLMDDNNNSLHEKVAKKEFFGLIVKILKFKDPPEVSLLDSSLI